MKTRWQKLLSVALVAWLIFFFMGPWPWPLIVALAAYVWFVVKREGFRFTLKRNVSVRLKPLIKK